jgi:hypothetical protein
VWGKKAVLLCVFVRSSLADCHTAALPSGQADGALKRVDACPPTVRSLAPGVSANPPSFHSLHISDASLNTAAPLAERAASDLRVAHS